MAYLTFVPQTPGGEAVDPGIFVQGTHIPGKLVEKSGVWFSSAGSAILMHENYRLSSCEDVLWIIVEEGTMTFEYHNTKLEVNAGECIVIPAETVGCTITDTKSARLLWFGITGPLTNTFLTTMNAYNIVPAKQGILPSMIEIAGQVMQVLVRHTGTSDASFQLQQLLWGFVAMYSGQSVARGVTLSHEIARVVDTLRACQYREPFSLADMAAISRMPVETFRKRFTVELGIPPLAYLQFLKMERAKTLLREGVSARQAGVEIGMPDPYHFSKQFKRVVGVSPTAYLKQVGLKGEKA